MNQQELTQVQRFSFMTSFNLN